MGQKRIPMSCFLWVGLSLVRWMGSKWVAIEQRTGRMSSFPPLVKSCLPVGFIQNFQFCLSWVHPLKAKLAGLAQSWYCVNFKNFQTHYTLFGPFLLKKQNVHFRWGPSKCCRKNSRNLGGQNWWTEFLVISNQHILLFYPKERERESVMVEGIEVVILWWLYYHFLHGGDV